MENIGGHKEHEEEGKLKKIILILLNLFLLFLLLSYFLLSSSLFPILESLFESKTAEKNKIILDEFSIHFKDKVYKELQEDYYTNQAVEFAACLKGEKEGRDYMVNEIYLPRMTEQSFNHVTFNSCSEDTLILLHSHPYRRCIASQQDLITLEKAKIMNEDRLMVVMCEPDRFSVYQ